MRAMRGVLLALMKSQRPSGDRVGHTFPIEPRRSTRAQRTGVLRRECSFEFDARQVDDLDHPRVDGQAFARLGKPLRHLSGDGCDQAGVAHGLACDVDG